MALKIKKLVKESENQSQVESQHSEEALNVEQLSEESLMLHEAMEIMEWMESNEVDAKKKRLEEIKKYFQFKADKSFKDDQEAKFLSEDEKVVLVFSKPSETTEVVDKPGVMSKLGDEAFFSIIKVGVTELKKYLSSIELESYTQKVRGSRRMKSLTRL